MLSLRVYRDAISKLSLRKKLTILVSVGVFLPLLVLTYLQYRSLTELQNKTKGAFKDNIRQGFTIVQQQMKQRLEEVAAQTLEPVANRQFSPPRAAEELEQYFAIIKRSHPEIEEIFALDYRGEQQATAYVYSDKFVKIAPSDFTDTLSSFDQARMAQSFVDGNRKYLFVPDKAQRAYLFYPLLDLTPGEQTGFAGVLLTKSFVSDDLIAGSVSKILNIYHGNTAPLSTIAFTISDENNQVLYSNGAVQNAYLLESNFDRPFSNWKAAVA